MNLYGYVEGNPINLVDPLGLISQRELDQMDCCKLLEEIHKTRNELLRSRQNQDSPVKRLRRAKSAYEYAKNYVDHRKDYWGRQSRLRDLLREFDDKNCGPGGMPPGARKLQDDRYPHFPWDEFMDHWGDGMNETMSRVNDWMNDPRNWIGLLAGARGGRRVPAGVLP